jgi:hypothetical protein
VVPIYVGVHDASSRIQHVPVGTLVRARTQTLEDVVRQAVDGDV